MNETVLIVEDSATVSYALERQLTEHGYRTITAGGVGAALESMAAEPAEAVLLDVMLPDGSGLDILTDLKEAATSPAVLIMTGQGSESVVVRAMRAGADDYLIKPIESADLEAALRSALERRRLERSEHGWERKRTETVLIVDDSAGDALDMERKLGGHLYRNLRVESASEALQRVTEEQPDAVLLDLVLPDEYGLDILPKLKGASSSPAVVVVTGRGSEELAVEAMRAGADDYLVKPVEEDELNRVLREALERRKRELADRALGKELSADLAAAAAVQRQLGQPDLPQLPGWRMAAKLVPARTVGGDTYGVVQNGDHFHVWVGDISGKGMAAALLAASVRALIRNQALTETDPTAIVNRVASLAFEDLAQSDSFLTLFFGTIETATGRAAFIDAGHGHARMRHAGGDWEELVCERGMRHCERAMPVGVVPEPGYAACTFTLDPGSHLAIYTDGLVELGDQPDCEAGTKLLMESIDGAIAAGAEHLAETRDAVFHGVDHVPQSDDRTFLILERSMGRGPVKAQLDLGLSELNGVSELVRRFSLALDQDEAAIYPIELALTEAFTNIVRHAHPEGHPAKQGVALELAVDDGALMCTFEDDGIPFDQSGGGASHDQVSESGRGLGVIAAAMDEVSYRRANGRNVLRMRKSVGR